MLNIFRHVIVLNLAYKFLPLFFREVFLRPVLFALDWLFLHHYYRLNGFQIYCVILSLVFSYILTFPVVYIFCFFSLCNIKNVLLFFATYYVLFLYCMNNINKFSTFYFFQCSNNSTDKTKPDKLGGRINNTYRNDEVREREVWQK